MDTLESHRGKVYNRISIINDVYRRNKVTWVMGKCECGSIKEYRIWCLKIGQTKSCGCLRTEGLPFFNRTHGKRKHPLYSVWAGIKRRCYNTNESAYAAYGARGISVCDEWRNNFMSFYNWAIVGYKKGLEIDRINNNANYEPSNCRWVSKKENCRNRSTTLLRKEDIETIKRLRFQEKKTLKEISNIYNVSINAIHYAATGKTWL